MFLSSVDFMEFAHRQLTTGSRKAEEPNQPFERAIWRGRAQWSDICLGKWSVSKRAGPPRSLVARRFFRCKFGVWTVQR